MMNRRDFLKGIGAVALGGLLARYHGAVIPGREQLVQLGKVSGVLRPHWQGVDLDVTRTIRVKIGDLFGGHQEWIVSVDHSCRECVDMTSGFLVPKRYRKGLIEFAKTGRVV